MTFFANHYPKAHLIPMRVLAHLGDAVYDLFCRESKLMTSASVQKMHQKVVMQVSHQAQARMLDQISGGLSEAESDIVRRARNLPARGKGKQDLSRKATAFEALLGYLYLTDEARLKQILEQTTNP